MSEMPRELHAAPVSNGARNTLSLLWSYAVPKRPTAWPSVGRMATETKQDERTIRKHLTELRGAGLIQKATRGSHFVWELLRPAATASDPTVVIDVTEGGAPTGRSSENERNEEAATRPLRAETPAPQGTQAYQLANQELNARARGGGDGLGPTSPCPEKQTPSDRPDERTIVDLSAELAPTVSCPALRGLMEGIARGEQVNLPGLLARDRRVPPKRKLEGGTCARTPARGTG